MYDSSLEQLIDDWVVVRVLRKNNMENIPTRFDILSFLLPFLVYIQYIMLIFESFELTALKMVSIRFSFAF